MNLADCTTGRRVIIGERFRQFRLNGAAGIIVLAETPEQLAARDKPIPDYPNGMVQVHLNDDVSWSCRDPWFDPSDLTPTPEDQ